MNGNKALPTLAELTQYSVNRENQYEATRQTLYDTLSYPATGTSNLTFFQDPIGQSGKTKEDTNMETGGTLPAPKHFLIQSIEIRVFPGVSPVTARNVDETSAAASDFTNDVYTLQQAGYLDLFIGSKSYLTEAPLGKFPPKTCLKTEFASGHLIVTGKHR